MQRARRLTDPTFADQLRDSWSQLTALAVSGVGGAYFRAVFAPEKLALRRIVQALAGAVSAVFLGGLLAHLIDEFFHAGVYSYLAAGFLMGTGGELAVKSIQDKLGMRGNHDDPRSRLDSE